MKQIPLTGKIKGYFAIVDDADYERVIAGPWYAHKGNKKNRSYYASRSVRISGNHWVEQKMHRFILELTNPKIDGEHEDGNGLNNRRSNLRICTRRRNMGNGRKRLQQGSKPCSSVFKGVSLNKKNGKWRAGITRNGKRKSLGHFVHEKDAALAYDKAAFEMWGEFARAGSES